MELARSSEYRYDSIKNVMQPRFIEILRQRRREAGGDKNVDDSNFSDDQDTDSLISDIEAEDEEASGEESKTDAWEKASRKCCPCLKSFKNKEEKEESDSGAAQQNIQQESSGDGGDKKMFQETIVQKPLFDYNTSMTFIILKDKRVRYNYTKLSLNQFSYDSPLRQFCIWMNE